MLRIGFILTPQFTLLPFAALVDALRLAADDGDNSRPIRCSWSVLAPSLDPIPASCGIKIEPTEVYCDPRQFDYLVIVSGLLKTKPDQRVIDYLKLADKARVSLIGVGTGSFTLLRAGIMRNKPCCVSWYHYQDLLNEFPNARPIADRLFVVSGRYITCAGGAGAIDLASWLIDRHLGAAHAKKSLHIMIVNEARSGLAPQPQPPMLGRVTNNLVRRAILLMEQNLSEPLKLAKMAEKLEVSRRQLERRFQSHVGMSVQAYSRHLRVYYGLWHLAKSDRTISAIAADCGFSDASHFIRCFRAVFNMSPLAMRKLGSHQIRSKLREFGGLESTDPRKQLNQECMLTEERCYVS